MYSKLKSFKTLQISLNGCVYFDHSAYFKTFKKYNFLEKSLVSNPSSKKKLMTAQSNFFYTKYRNQIFKNLINTLTVNCKKYSKFIKIMSVRKNSTLWPRFSNSCKTKFFV